MMLQIHNTLTGRKEPFQPARAGEVRMYVCGITPYDTGHLGHARCYVVFDVIRRVLRAEGFKVRFIQNITDVDDKILQRASERGVRPSELVQQYVDDFFSKMDALGIERADAYPRVTQHIPEIIALIQKLVEKRAAYPLGGDVYFSVRACAAYGKLSHHAVDELRAGARQASGEARRIGAARLERYEGKKDPLDFALWKASKPGEPDEAGWDSPWGRGRPGWHIECSAMALKHLGPNFDIHGGGLDLIFPHHENEIAQSETAMGEPFARVWIHNGFVTLNREKMSKSLGNFFTLSEIFARHHPSSVRYMLLSTHYRSPLDFSDELLAQNRQALAGLKDAVARATRALLKRDAAGPGTDRPPPPIVTEADQLAQSLRQALANDFNTPEALAMLHRMAGLLEKQYSGNAVQRAGVRCVLERLRSGAELLGLDLFSFIEGLLIPPEVTELAERREVARRNKDWPEADRLRQAILSHGYVVEDTSDGPRLLPKAN